MKAINPTVRRFASLDAFFKTCALKCGSCKGRVQWHHNLIYAGSQVSDDITTLIPLCESHHALADRKDVKEVLDWIMFVRGCNPHDYPKGPLAQRFKYLETKTEYLESQRANFTLG